MTTTTTNKVLVNKDLANKKITVIREFDAPVEKVWKAWTQKELLDEWWAPKPWKTRTKTIDFREGGHWLYAMVGPTELNHLCALTFLLLMRIKVLLRKIISAMKMVNVPMNFPVCFGIIYSPAQERVQRLLLN